MMIYYSISGNLPAPWEDFMYRGADKDLADRPNLMISAQNEEDAIPLPEGRSFITTQEVVEKQLNDGFVDATVRGDVVTLESAQRVIAIVNRCELSEVVIEQAGLCQSF